MTITYSIINTALREKLLTTLLVASTLLIGSSAEAQDFHVAEKRSKRDSLYKQPDYRFFGQTRKMMTADGDGKRRWFRSQMAFIPDK